MPQETLQNVDTQPNTVYRVAMDAWRGHLLYDGIDDPSLSHDAVVVGYGKTFGEGLPYPKSPYEVAMLLHFESTLALYRLALIAEENGAINKDATKKNVDRSVFHFTNNLPQIAGGEYAQSGTLSSTLITDGQTTTSSIELGEVSESPYLQLFAEGTARMLVALALQNNDEKITEVLSDIGVAYTGKQLQLEHVYNLIGDYLVRDGITLLSRETANAAIKVSIGKVAKQLLQIDRRAGEYRGYNETIKSGDKLRLLWEICDGTLSETNVKYAIYRDVFLIEEGFFNDQEAMELADLLRLPLLHQTFLNLRMQGVVDEVFSTFRWLNPISHPEPIDRRRKVGLDLIANIGKGLLDEKQKAKLVQLIYSRLIDDKVKLGRRFQSSADAGIGDDLRLTKLRSVLYKLSNGVWPARFHSDLFQPLVSFAETLGAEMAEELIAAMAEVEEMGRK